MGALRLGGGAVLASEHTDDELHRLSRRMHMIPKQLKSQAGPPYESRDRQSG